MTISQIACWAIAALVCLFLTGPGLRAGEQALSSQASDGKSVAKATFAGGCFWCMEPPFRKLGGVVKVVSGYTGGTGADPDYDDYADKGHVEAIEVTYDASVISYGQLLEVFWQQIDPTDAGGQFADRGPHYRSAIFYHDDQEKALAEKSKKDLQASGRFDKPVVTEILKASVFYPAEDYHQDYSKKNPIRYKAYRTGSGRERFLDKTWRHDRDSAAEMTPTGKYPGSTKEELKKKLSPLQYKVTQECGTEPAFQNAYWDNHREGIYVDVVSGEPLFSSVDKFDSGTGWPSFTRPLERDNVVERTDSSLGMTRTEARSRHANSHLGHVFDDGPKPAGIRYCMNSAALRFVPKEDLEKEGYGKYKSLFDK